MATCPCCGSKIAARTPVSELRSKLPGKLLPRVVGAMARSPGEWFTIEALADAAYRDDPNGGPLSGGRSVQVRICQQRSRLNSLGWDIEGRVGSGYRLVALA